MRNIPVFCLSLAPYKDSCRQLPKRTWTIRTTSTPPPPCSATSTGTAVSSCEDCPGYHGHAWPITCPRSRGRLTERRVPTAIPPAPFPLVPLSTIFSTLCHWPRACPLPPLLPSSVSSLCPPCCGSRSQSLGLFAFLSVPCPAEPAMSFAVVGQTAQAHCSPPPSSLSTSGQLLIRVAARVRPTGSSAHRWCGALASHLLCRFFCFCGSHAPCGSDLHLCPPPLGPAATTLEPAHGARRFPNISRCPTTTPRRACHLRRSVRAV